jgi:putative Mn2+ efflux pump MntP
MSIVDYLSHNIFSQDSTAGFRIAGVLFLLLTLRAIIQLKKTKLIIDFFKEPKTIGQLILISLWCYLIYSYVTKNKHSKDKKTLENIEKLQNATKKALLALLIAFFASIDLVIAPFWLIWVIAYYLEDWV